jgi:Flp pilus assembly pilin Flp
MRRSSTTPSPGGAVSSAQLIPRWPLSGSFLQVPHFEHPYDPQRATEDTVLDCNDLTVAGLRRTISSLLLTLEACSPLFRRWLTQPPRFCQEVKKMNRVLKTLWSNQQGQDIAEYAVMLAVILVIVVGTIRLVGSNANKVFSSVASSVQ